MKLVAAAAIAAVSFAAMPAAAATFDAFAAFDGTSATSGPFSFGTVSGTTYSALPTGGTCLIANTVCLTSGNYLGIYKTADGLAHPGTGTIDVPGDALIFHPGSAGEVAAVFFTAPTTGVYAATLSAFQATNTNANSVALFGYNGLGTSSFSFPGLSVGSPDFDYSEGGIALLAGQTIGFGVGYDGNYQYDSTGVNFSVSGPVPEPASWALMIVGFGLVGAAMRRRTLAAA